MYADNIAYTHVTNTDTEFSQHHSNANETTKRKYKHVGG